MTYNVSYSVSPPSIRNTADPGAVWLHRDTTAAPALVLSGSDRAFHVVGHGSSGSHSLARVVTEQSPSRVSGRPGVYRVVDPQGAPLGRMTLRRGLLLGFGRTRWTVEPVAGPALRGFRGRMGWWVLWWPFGFPLSLVVAIWSVFSDWGDGGFRAPRRVIWRDDSGRAHVVFRGMAEDYQVLTVGWDPRLIAALIGLHQSFDPNEGAKTGGWYKS
ncbi:hypothetical protein [Streptomyces cyaneus]|uniref:hypothetical protein n=1 Tax=Streptomyces cyaneus TaxID=1904 RepID=UPI000FF8B42C|nr:hypothetical protein [Streptomyces cyaneus]